jgi:hypothetical protein
VLVDEHVDPVSYFRNGSPSIAHDETCSPHVLYSVPDFFGRLASRVGADDWDDVATPDPLALGGVVYDADLHGVRIFEYDGAFGIAQQFYDGTSFFEYDALPGSYITGNEGVASLGHGIIHLGVYGSSNNAGYARYDGAGWSSTEYQESTWPVAVAVSPNEDAHVTYFGTDTNWQLMYVAAPDSDPELVVDYGSNVLSLGTHGLATVDTTPHAVLARVGDGGLHEIVHAERMGPDDWTVEAIVAEDDSGAELCAYEPMFDGETCDYDYVRYRALGIATSHGGDVRIFYARDHFMGSLVADCEGFGCFWLPSADDSESSAWIAAPNGVDYDTAMWLDRWIQGMDVDVDGTGQMHIAAYVVDGRGTVVDYVLLAP